MSSRPHANPDVEHHRKKCAQILGISPKIRYAGSINKYGRTLAGALRKGVMPFLNPEEARNEYFIAATRNSLRKSFEKSIGKTEYTLTENEKVKILTVNAGENFYYISMDKETPISEVSKIIEDVKKIV